MRFHEVVVILTGLSIISASAPDDVDSFCTDVTQASLSTPPPVHPPNSIILMDSYNYINLLPPHAGPAWQMVDNDANNIPGRGTEWTQNTNTPCRQNVNACGFSVGTQNNWLITQHIRRTVSNFTRVSVLVEFELRGCDNADCRRTFAVYKYESSELNPSEVRNISRFQRAGRVATEDDTGQTRQNRTVNVNLDTDEDGFYLAIVDETTCIGVTRVIVFYNVCPGGAVNFVNRPETLAPLFGLQSQPVTVMAQCVDGASPENGASVYLSCSQGGVWFPSPGGGCTCNPGHKPSQNGQTCEGCPAGTYLSGGQMCLDCPDNSESAVSGVSECPCMDGFYRADGEEDFACTQPPTQPRNVQIVAVTTTSVTLRWEESDDGGRDDLVYIVFYQERGTGMIVEGGRFQMNEGTVTGLEQGVTYDFFVTARNGVSKKNETDLTTPEPKTVTTLDGVLIIIGVVVGLSALVILIIGAIVVGLVLWYKRPRKKSMYVLSSQEAIPIPVSTKRTYVDPTTYASPDEAIEEFAREIEPKTLRLDAEIGAGEFGTVFRGMWREQPKKQVAVAVKTLKPGSSGKMRNEFLNEASIMGQFQHDHVIKLYGVVTKVDPAMIVMEFMDNGSLYSYLRKNDEKLTPLRLLKMARCVCSGMEYLSTVGYVHRDLAARNVLVGKEEVCKVADFGLSRDLVDDEYTVQKGGKIPVRWTAPEAIYRRKFTSSSDVWSYGVLLWEVMTYAQHPYDDWGNQDVLDQLEAGYRLEKPHGCTDAVYEIMLDCWNKELSRRPTFTEILKRLDLLLNTDSPPKRPPKKMRSSVNSASNPLQCKTVEDWLKSVKMERYIPVFQENGINSVNQLVHLTEPDLREMGITLAGHLHRLTQSIENGYMELKRSSMAAT